MNAQEKNALIEAAKANMNTAIGLVIADVYSGMVAAPALMLSAAVMIRATGDEPDAAQAEARAAECPAILLVPWPFIYIASNAWISAVATLRDSLPYYLDLEKAEKRRAAAVREREEGTARSRAQWEALSEVERTVLGKAGIKPEMLSRLGTK